jgi:hypothetical protein
MPAFYAETAVSGSKANINAMQKNPASPGQTPVGMGPIQRLLRSGSPWAAKDSVFEKIMRESFLRSSSDDKGASQSAEGEER